MRLRTRPFGARIVVFVSVLLVLFCSPAFCDDSQSNNKQGAPPESSPAAVDTKDKAAPLPAQKDKPVSQAITSGVENNNDNNGKNGLAEPVAPSGPAASSPVPRPQSGPSSPWSSGGVRSPAVPSAPDAGERPSLQGRRSGVSAGAGSARATTARGTGDVTFFFDDADVFEVIQTVFGDILKVNYIIDQRVKGRVNFRTVAPVPRDEVLPVIEVILRLNGIGYVVESGLYRIVPLEEVPKELVYSQVGKPPDQVAIELFTFKNVMLKESMGEIESALGLHLKAGMVRIIPLIRLNALIVIAASKESLAYIRQWVETFDAMFAVARPKVFVYPLQSTKAAHIASILQSIFTGSSSATSSTQAPKSLTPTTTTPQTSQSSMGTSSSTLSSSQQTSSSQAQQKIGASTTATGTGFLVSADTRVIADEMSNALVILATPADFAFIEETIKKLDAMPRQVVIEGLLVLVDLSDDLKFGVAWSLNTDINISGLKPFTRPINLLGDVINAPGQTLDKTVSSSDSFTFVATDPTGVVRAKIIATLKDGKANILASPHILVSDNREARIQVGSQVPLATSSTTTPIGGTLPSNTTTSTIQYKDIGIILKVKPQVNDSGLVLLELTQEISSIGQNVKIAGQDYASINKVEATSNLVAQNGETVVIGGLIREDINTDVTGIPVLSKIPLVGGLFSYTSATKKRQELVLLLTPRVVRNQKEAEEVSSRYTDRLRGTRAEEMLKEQEKYGIGVKDRNAVKENSVAPPGPTPPQ